MFPQSNNDENDLLEFKLKILLRSVDTIHKYSFKGICDPESTVRVVRRMAPDFVFMQIGLGLELDELVLRHSRFWKKSKNGFVFHKDNELKQQLYHPPGLWTLDPLPVPKREALIRLMGDDYGIPPEGLEKGLVIAKPVCCVAGDGELVDLCLRSSMCYFTFAVIEPLVYESFMGKRENAYWLHNFFRLITSRGEGSILPCVLNSQLSVLRDGKWHFDGDDK